ncbi:PHP domain-containing protein [Jatrophihabitans sp. YIM 134969]
MSLVSATSTDWHTHSSLTDGADDPEAMADAAVRAGLEGWGLSDHVRADSDWVPAYVERVRAIRRDGLTVHLGVEAKLLDADGRLDLPPGLPVLDHVLVADHQFPAPGGPATPSTVRGWLESGAWTPAGVVDTLVVATCNGVAQAPAPAVVAHLFSLLPKVGLAESDVTTEHRDALAAACLAADAAVEVNEKWRCPSAVTVEHLRAAGVRIVRGSDAHAVAEVGRHAYWDEVTAAAPGLTLSG